MKEYRDEVEVVAVIEDRYGEKRNIGYQRRNPGRLKVLYQNITPSLKLSRAAGQLIGDKIRFERKLAGLTLAELAIKAGLKGTPKVRMYEIEKHIRPTGVKIGTLYALAMALNIPIQRLMPPADEVAAYAGMEMGETKTETIIKSKRGSG